MSFNYPFLSCTQCTSEMPEIRVVLEAGAKQSVYSCRMPVSIEIPSVFVMYV